MAFVLLALVLLAVIAFVFFLRFSQQKIIESAENVKAQTTISLLERVTSLPELECHGKTLCIDSDKAGFFKEQLKTNKNLELLFQGLTNVRIKPIYPSSNDIEIYNKGQGNVSYSTFIDLCKYVSSGTSFNYECSMAMLIARQ